MVIISLQIFLTRSLTHTLGKGFIFDKALLCLEESIEQEILKRNEKVHRFVNWSLSQVLEGRPQYVEMAGNLIPITKSGDQLYISFKAFRENRLPCLVKIRDRDQEPAARVAFMKEPKVVRGELPQTPICNLNISLPDMSTVRLSFTLIYIYSAEIKFEILTTWGAFDVH